MLTLPREIVIQILNSLKKRWAYDWESSEGEENQTTLKLCKEFGECNYYEGMALYQTCKSLRWLKDLEIIHIQSAEFYHDIVISNINGSFMGELNGGAANSGLMGYSLNGQENVYDVYGNKRCIDGIWYEEKREIWKTNKQLAKIKKQIFEVDKDLETFFNTTVEDQNEIILLREPNKLLKKLKFTYKHKLKKVE